ncbi:hypothetical protein D4764_12G0002670 [Takifugu flavidus]|uniref:Uncharacterized protein n=1 Tax=Takifugu flavidus TaxID=433684 RepID=A0A5C6PF05_9TELE|nr:hypothetical protein D4764_12G0002670 [Takifugu flavidus]
MADHTPPLESGQLLSPELPVLASPPPPAMVNGEGPQQFQHWQDSPAPPPPVSFDFDFLSGRPAAPSHQRTANN